MPRLPSSVPRSSYTSASGYAGATGTASGYAGAIGITGSSGVAMTSKLTPECIHANLFTTTFYPSKKETAHDLLGIVDAKTFDVLTDVISKWEINGKKLSIMFHLIRGSLKDTVKEIEKTGYIELSFFDKTGEFTDIVKMEVELETWSMFGGYDDADLCHIECTYTINSINF